jgi:hypothetical protein
MGDEFIELLVDESANESTDSPTFADRQLPEPFNLSRIESNRDVRIQVARPALHNASGRRLAATTFVP